MEHEFNTLTILAEVTIGFVAFAAIVASLRVTLGKRLTPFQRLLVHFFTESGMIAVSVSLLPLVLWGFWQDEVVVASYTIGYTLFAAGGYLMFYIRRRMRIKAPTPWPSLFVMIGYGIWLGIFILSLSGVYFQPSLALVAAMSLWGLCSSVVIFVTFLSTFVDNEKDGE